MINCFGHTLRICCCLLGCLTWVWWIEKKTTAPKGGQYIDEVSCLVSLTFRPVRISKYHSSPKWHPEEDRPNCCWLMTTRWVSVKSGMYFYGHSSASATPGRRDDGPWRRVVICSQSISSHRYRVINDWTVTLCTWWVHSCGIKYSSVPFSLVKVHLSIFNRSFHLPINPRSKIYSSSLVDRQLLPTRSFMAWTRRSMLTISGDE